MPKSRGRRKPQHRSPRPRTLRTEAEVVTDMQKYASFDQNRNPQKDYKSSRSAMVAWSIVHGRRFPIGSVLDNPGPNGEAWTNAWYTAKENKDKGWRYCEGVVKIPDGMMTSA